MPGVTFSAFRVASWPPTGAGAGAGGGGGGGGAGAGAAEVAFTLYVFVVFPSAAVTTITIVVFAPGVRGTALPAPPLTTLLPCIVIVALLLFKLAMTCTLLRFAASGQV